VKATMASYFFAEKWEGLAFVLVGIAAMALTVALFRGPYRGMGIPLVLVGLLQIGVGGAVFRRSDAQLAELTTQLESAPAIFQSREAARMEKVMTNFRLYKMVEICIFVLGVGLTFLFPHRDLLFAAGIGCVAQGAFMLVLDLFAEHRGAVYLAAVRALA
jgi:hypothetical protein